MVWLIPASAVVGAASIVIVKLSPLSAHNPLEIVQLNTKEVPEIAVTVEVGEFGLVIVPIPLITVHVPVPTTGVFPAKVTEPIVLQIV